jgi:hypothetical protein
LERLGRMGSSKSCSRMILNPRLKFVGIAFGLLVVLAGCSSSSLNNLIAVMPAEVGLPADTPERSAEPAAYPAVHDMPPPRANTTLSAEEQVRLEDELVAVRARQATVATPAAPAVKRKVAPAMQPAPRVIPASSSNTIY